MAGRNDIRMLVDLALSRDYTEANRSWMNRRVRADLMAAIGG